MLPISLKKNDLRAKWVIGGFSAVVFLVVVALSNVKITANFGFNIHIFALANTVINSLVAVLLLAALLAVKQRKYTLHRNIMMAALVLSVLFLLSYITHKLFAGEAKFGDADFNGILSNAEKQAVGGIRYLYLLLLITHIFLAAVILPFILFTTYRGLISEFPAHKKIARITWPLWFYVAVSGPVVYLFISKYYN